VAVSSVSGLSHGAATEEGVTEQLAGTKTASRRWNVRLRVTWTLVSIFVVECLVFGLAMLPGALFWEVFSLLSYPYVLVRIIVLSMAFVPAYGLFAVSLMVLSALSTRWLGWRTPANAEMPIKALEWPLLHWVRYMVSVHIVRLFAGSVFRATPLWTFYLRLNGARLGRGVYVNSLGVNDHNLLEFGDGVVIGDGVHLSGHTVEHGVVKTARVRLGNNVSIGLGTVVGIGVEAGDRCQVGALSLVPKFSRLKPDATYVGAPVRELRQNERWDETRAQAGGSSGCA
jgi:acetyltransferase-like isoleucine patch superfamily enzyme